MLRRYFGVVAACAALGCSPTPSGGSASGMAGDTVAQQPGKQESGRGGAQAGSGGASAAARPAEDASEAPDAESESEPGSKPAPGRVPLGQRVCGDALGMPQSFPASPAAELVQAGFGFLEGPVWLADQGVLVFSDMDFPRTAESGPPARIRRFRPPSTFDVLVESANSNGLALDVDGALLGCTQDVQSLSRFDPESGARSTLALTFMGNHFNSPNDAAVRSDGTIYFTDPDWQLGGRRSETGTTGVYRVTPDRQVLLVTDRLQKPNGIALSLDERTLYVGSAGDDVLAYPLDASGGAGEGVRFASPGASDGMTLDCAGNLYVTGGGGVQVFSPAGAPLARIEVAEEPSNLAFGGEGNRTLYITAGAGLYRLVLGAPGLPY